MRNGRQIDLIAAKLLENRSSFTTTRNCVFPFSLCSYIINSTLGADCHVLNKLSSIPLTGVHSPDLSASSYEILPWRSRVFKTSVDSLKCFGSVRRSADPFGEPSGRNCDRWNGALRLENCSGGEKVSLHQTIRTFSPRILVISSVIVSSRIGRLPEQMTVTTFFSECNKSI